MAPQCSTAFTVASPTKKARIDGAQASSSGATGSPLQSSSSAGRKKPLPLHPFFHSTSTSSSSPTPTCLPPITISGLTRSQRITSVLSGIDPRSLTFSGSESDAFFLFMRLRAEHKWASYNMSPSKWVEAASIYNTEVDRLNTQKHKNLVRKTPRSLMEKLGEVESRVLARIATNNYACTFYTPAYLLPTLIALPIIQRSERAKRGSGASTAMLSR